MSHVRHLDPSLTALRRSVDNLAEVAGSLDDQTVDQPAYPSEWTIADVISHLGSGAVIWRQRMEDMLVGRDTPEGFNQGVWDEWNAKRPADKARDGLVADGEFMARLERLSPQEREEFSIPMGPMSYDLAGFVQLRLTEHAVHTWDVAVAVDSSASLDPVATELSIDRLGMIAAWSARPSGEPRTVTIRTTAPDRTFAVTITPERVCVDAADDESEVDVAMPGEAFVRLVYGRLDSDHTPGAVSGDGPTLDQLRAVFPGL